jgi:hypothetical protein
MVVRNEVVREEEEFRAGIITTSILYTSDGTQGDDGGHTKEMRHRERTGVRWQRTTDE